MLLLVDNTGFNFLQGDSTVNVPMTQSNHLGHLLAGGFAPGATTGRFIGPAILSEGIGMGDNSTLILDSNG
ncbi:MAG: hypothetical protein RCG15_08360 [Candidatus Rickettsia vulgarisii]